MEIENEAHKRGLDAYKKGDYKEAIRLFSVAIKENPNSAESYYERAKAYCGMGDHEKAIEDCGEAIGIKPDFADAYYSRGGAYIVIGKNDKAIADLSEVLRLNPNYPIARYDRAAAYKVLGEYDKAIADLDAAIALNPNDNVARAFRALCAHESPGASGKQEMSVKDANKPKTRMSDGRELCCIFSFPDADAAARNFDFEIVESYGDAYRDCHGKVVHYLHTWDDGDRTLIRCRKCGALLLRQDSEIHDMSYGNDSYYTRLVPVESRDEALAYNKKYSGYALENEYKGVEMWDSSKGWVWNITEDGGKNDRQKAEEEEKEK
jgi:tetratricopeptide (TPR) repeat protein